MHLRSTPAASVTTWTPASTRTRLRVAEQRRAQGLLDTSVIVDLERLDPSLLPVESAVSAITMAELAAGPHTTHSTDERARRQDRLQRAEAVFDPLPFDTEASRAYGRVYAAVIAAGRKPRGARSVDLLIAAVACSKELPLYTRATRTTSKPSTASSRSSPCDSTGPLRTADPRGSTPR